MASLLSWGKKQVKRIYDDVNVFDGGKSHGNPQGATRYAPQQPQARPTGPPIPMGQPQTQLVQAPPPPKQKIIPLAVAPTQPVKIANAPVVVPNKGDVAGIKDALQQLHKYGQDDQARIVNRASRAGVVPHNVAAAYQNQILSPQINQDESKLAQITQSLAAPIPFSRSLAMQGGTNLAANSLYNKALKTGSGYGNVKQTIDTANLNNGINPNASVGHYAQQTIGRAVGAVPETLSGGLLGKAEQLHHKSTYIQ